MRYPIRRSNSRLSFAFQEPSLRELSAADLPQEDFLGVWPSTSAKWAFYVKVAVPMRLPDAGQLRVGRPQIDDCRSVFRSRSCLGDSRPVHENPCLPEIIDSIITEKRHT